MERRSLHVAGTKAYDEETKAYDEETKAYDEEIRRKLMESAHLVVSFTTFCLVTWR